MSGPGLHPDERPFDPGLQAERTLLAWRRTCLALAGGNAVAIRYVTDALGAWAAVIGVVGLVLSVAGWLIATVRYRRAHLGLVREARLTTDGRLPLMVAASVFAACVSGVALVFVFGMRP